MNEPCFSGVNTQIFDEVELNKDSGKLGWGRQIGKEEKEKSAVTGVGDCSPHQAAFFDFLCS